MPPIYRRTAPMIIATLLHHYSIKWNNLPMDRLDELRLFASVATHRSFAQAARAHRRSPQAVTRAIASLEERAGARLLQRTTRSVSLTGEGERYLELARRALAEFDLLDAHADPRAPLRGALSV